MLSQASLPTAVSMWRACTTEQWGCLSCSHYLSYPHLITLAQRALPAGAASYLFSQHVSGWTLRHYSRLNTNKIAPALHQWVITPPSHTTTTKMGIQGSSYQGYAHRLGGYFVQGGGRES